MELDEEDGPFSKLVIESRGFVNGAKSVALLIRRICFQTSCQSIVCTFSLMCTLFLYKWRFIDPVPLYVSGEKWHCMS